MANNWYTNCAKCGKYGRKKEMRLLYSGRSSMPPNILCYLCEFCYCELLDTLEVAEDGK